MSFERIYKKTSLSITQLINTCTSILKVLVTSKFSSHIHQTNTSTCVILGNGPSLKTSLINHKSFFEKNTLFCVNSFSMSEQYSILKPKYYIILDNGFWLGDAKIILDTFDALKTKTTWPLQLFIPQIASKSKRLKELTIQNPNIHLTYYNYTVFKGFERIANFFYKKNLAMPQSQNVLVAAIFLAINSGFKKIIIVGADHTWHETLHLNENNTLCIKDVHFYDNEENITFIPFKKGPHSNETFKVHEIFATWAKVFYGYLELKKYSRYKKCNIYNGSEVTFIDAFERMKLPNN